MADIKYSALDQSFDCAVMFVCVSFKTPHLFSCLASWLWSKGNHNPHRGVLFVQNANVMPKRKRGIQRKQWKLWHILNWHAKQRSDAAVLTASMKGSLLKINLKLQTSSEDEASQRSARSVLTSEESYTSQQQRSWASKTGLSSEIEGTVHAGTHTREQTVVRRSLLPWKRFSPEGKGRNEHESTRTLRPDDKRQLVIFHVYSDSSSLQSLDHVWILSSFIYLFLLTVCRSLFSHHAAVLSEAFWGSSKGKEDDWKP